MKRKRATTIVIHDAHILGFNAVDPANQESYFLLPGGKVEEHETSQQAAVRETLEETGYAIAIDEKSKHSLEYDFHWNGQSYSCCTDFFIGHLLNLKALEVNDAHYHQGVYWCPLNILPQKLANYPEVLRDFILLACGT